MALNQRLAFTGMQTANAEEPRGSIARAKRCSGKENEVLSVKQELGPPMGFAFIGIRCGEGGRVATGSWHFEKPSIDVWCKDDYSLRAPRSTASEGCITKR